MESLGTGERQLREGVMRSLEGRRKAREGLMESLEGRGKTRERRMGSLHEGQMEGNRERDLWTT
jgi:hypothetical protein